jgi:hypothetical protein
MIGINQLRWWRAQARVAQSHRGCGALQLWRRSFFFAQGYRDASRCTDAQAEWVRAIAGFESRKHSMIWINQPR